MLLLLLCFLSAALLAFLYWSWLQGQRLLARLPGTALNPFFERCFKATTMANFKVPYRLIFEAKDLSVLYSIGLSSPVVQDVFFDVEDPFNPKYFHVGESAKFRFGWPAKTRPEQGYLLDPGLQMSRFVERAGSQFISDFSVEEVSADIGKIKFDDGYIALHNIQPDISADLIEENYAMLTDEDKQEIRTERSYNALEEKLTVAFLKRGLDFQKRQMKQRHESGLIDIETEPAGELLRINWQFKTDLGGFLMGFRRTGSFFPNAWDEENNGLLVIHSMRSGEAFESLKGGTTYFYTFILKAENKKGKIIPYSIARFQITMPPAEAFGGLARQRIAQAIERVGLAVEFHDAMDAMRMNLIERVKRMGLPPEEEERKIMDVQDIVDLQRQETEL